MNRGEKRKRLVATLLLVGACLVAISTSWLVLGWYGRPSFFISWFHAVFWYAFAIWIALHFYKNLKKGVFEMQQNGVPIYFEIATGDRILFARSIIAHAAGFFIGMGLGTALIYLPFVAT
ncbi:MAG: hypothetical protein Q7R47_06615 [Candidatus Diapherotrites archaeon]|nr:hypothetical protein [Candidatus Diapherotrites archaeon]